MTGAYLSRKTAHVRGKETQINQSLQVGVVTGTAAHAADGLQRRAHTNTAHSTFLAVLGISVAGRKQPAFELDPNLLPARTKGMRTCALNTVCSLIIFGRRAARHQLVLLRRVCQRRVGRVLSVGAFHVQVPGSEAAESLQQRK